MKNFKMEDVPLDVMWVWSLEMGGQPVGLETLKKAKEIAEKYPEWFDNEKEKNTKLPHQ